MWGQNDTVVTVIIIYQTAVVTVCVSLISGPGDII